MTLMTLRKILPILQLGILLVFTVQLAKKEATMIPLVELRPSELYNRAMKKGWVVLPAPAKVEYLELRKLPASVDMLLKFLSAATLLHNLNKLQAPPDLTTSTVSTPRSKASSSVSFAEASLSSLPNSTAQDSFESENSSDSESVTSCSSFNDSFNSFSSISSYDDGGAGPCEFDHSPRQGVDTVYLGNGVWMDSV